MNPQQRFNGFHFDDDFIVHQKVNPVATVEPYDFVRHRQIQLPKKTHPAQAQLMAQTLFVRRLQQSWSQGTMNFDGCSDDALSSWIFVPYFSVPLW
jgi:hypothetical protein